MVAGFLMERDYSLQPDPEILSAYKAKRDHMLDALEKHFPKSQSWTSGVSWNRPVGGFFMVLWLPFDVGAKEAAECVRDFGVIFTPMSFFSIGGGCGNMVRLAFSKTSTDQIEEGIKRLAAYVKQKAMEKAGLAPI